MNAPRHISRLRQQGMVTVLAVIFLITAVIFVLSQTLGITGSNSIDTAQQLDSEAALFLAESGIEAATGSLTSTANSGGTVDSTTCVAVASGAPCATNGSVSLGRGTYCYGTPTASLSGCTTACKSCTVPATGKVGSAKRTLSIAINLSTIYGKSGIGGQTNASCVGQNGNQPINLTVKNPYPVQAVAMLNMGYRQHIPAAGQIAVVCNSPNILWNYFTQNGNPGVQVFGDEYTVAGSQGVTSLPLGLDHTTDYAAVGAVFPGFSTSAPPTLIGEYSSQGNSNGSGTGTATVTSGVANSWCAGADILVIGFGARAGSTSDSIATVVFNSGTPAQPPAQAITLTTTLGTRGGLVVHYPDPTAIGAPGDVFSDIWFAYNPDFAFATPASSYKGIGTGAIGATFNGGVPSGSNTLTVASVTANEVISAGDTITTAGGALNLVIQPYGTSGTTGTGGAGTYQLSANASATVAAGSSLTVKSAILYVSACTFCDFENGDTLSGGSFSGNINAPQLTLQAGEAAGGNGRYPISLAPTTVTPSNVLARTPSNTIYVPSASPIPSVTTPATIITVYSGAATGQFAQQTTVTAVNSPPPTYGGLKSFNVSAAPTTPLNNATICGGTCAFFDNPSSTTQTTTFSVSGSAGLGQWAAGFACLKGVDASKIFPLTNTTTKAGAWTEVIN